MKKGFVCSAFDLLHAGHMLMLKDAREHCDYLIAGLQVDPSITDASYRGKKKNKPIMSLEERRIILEGVRYVDEVIIYETEEELYELLKKLKPDIRIIGSDWQGKQFTGYDLPMEIYFHNRSHNYSTTELRQRIAKAEAEKDL